MHALDCFLEQLATQSETDAERKVYSRKRRSWSRESESERVKSPFRCNDFLGEEQTHGRILFVRVSRTHIYIHELWHRDEDGNAYTPGGGVPFLFAVSSEKETKRERERERERESLSMAAKKKKKKKTNDDKETKKEEEEKTKIKRHKSTTLVRGTATFDNNKRVDFVTGFRKRKNTRRKKAATEFEKKLKEERREAKMNKRRTFREMLGLKADDDQEEEEEEEKKEEKKREEKAYASGVSVVIEGL